MTEQEPDWFIAWAKRSLERAMAGEEARRLFLAQAPTEGTITIPVHRGDQSAERVADLRGILKGDNDMTVQEYMDWTRGR